MADLTQFDFPSAVRIGRVVRAVEQEPRRARPLTFGAVDEARKPKVFRVATFTGDWDKNSSKTVTFKNQTTTPNTVSASNLLFDVAGPSGETATQVCIVGKEGTAWYFVNSEKPACDDGSYKSEELSPSASSSSDASDLTEGDGPQVLVNDKGCVKWVKLRKFYAVGQDGSSDGIIRSESQGLAWKIQPILGFLASEGASEETIPCQELGPIITGGDVDLGDFGSGSVEVTEGGGSCGKVINVNISLNTDECSTE
jgi:hypothetical protein